MSEVADLAHFARRGDALIGLDVGTKTIGVAASGAAGVAAPVTVLRRSKFRADAQRLQELASERGAVGFVVGLPLNMDGGVGPRAQASRAFARNLAEATGLSVALWDERYSTAAVERALIAQDMRRDRRADVIDAHAAAFILQGALDRLRLAETAP